MDEFLVFVGSQAHGVHTLSFQNPEIRGSKAEPSLGDEEEVVVRSNLQCLAVGFGQLFESVDHPSTFSPQRIGDQNSNLHTISGPQLI